MLKIVFGTDGWRAVIGRDFTPYNVRVVAQAIADHLRDCGLNARGIVVGYDTRKGSRYFAEEVCKVMIGNDIQVYLTKRDTPTPVVAYEVLRRSTGGAVMITASHNPPEWNGVKYIPEYAGPALPNVTDAIGENIDRLFKVSEIKQSSIKKLTQSRLLEEINPTMSYIDFVESQMDSETIKRAKLRIVCDPMYGTARGYLDRILKRANCNVKVIHGNPDPDFGGHRPEPIPEFLTNLKAEISRFNADLGLATDGDCDRMAAYDQNGTYFSANQLLPILFNYLVESGRRGGLVRSVATTHFADRIAADHGLPVYEVPVGFKYVGQYLREKNVVIGAEESGGLSFKGHISEKDGIFTCAKIVEVRAETGKSLSQLLSELRSKYGPCINKRDSVQCTNSRKKAVMERLAMNIPSEIGGLSVLSYYMIDGVKYILEDKAWILIRPSGTEPLIRIYAESTDEKTLNTILEGGRELVFRAVQK